MLDFYFYFIGFILLYCLYAVIVVVGRYVRLKCELENKTGKKLIYIYKNCFKYKNIICYAFLGIFSHQLGETNLYTEQNI